MSCHTLLVTAQTGHPFQLITRHRIRTEEGVAVNSGSSPHTDFQTPFQSITAETSCTTACTLCPPPRIIVLIQATYII